MGRLDSKKNSRPELKRKCWPNIYISNLKLGQTPDIKKVYLYKVHGTVDLSNRIDYLSRIDNSDITRNDNNVKMDICNEPVRVKRNAQIDINDTTILIDTKNLKNN